MFSRFTLNQTRQLMYAYAVFNEVRSNIRRFNGIKQNEPLDAYGVLGAFEDIVERRVLHRVLDHSWYWGEDSSESGGFNTTDFWEERNALYVRCAIRICALFANLQLSVQEAENAKAASAFKECEDNSGTYRAGIKLMRRSLIDLLLQYEREFS